MSRYARPILKAGGIFSVDGVGRSPRRPLPLPNLLSVQWPGICLFLLWQSSKVLNASRLCVRVCRDREGCWAHKCWEQPLCKEAESALLVSQPRVPQKHALSPAACDLEGHLLPAQGAWSHGPEPPCMGCGSHCHKAPLTGPQLITWETKAMALCTLSESTLSLPRSPLLRLTFSSNATNNLPEEESVNVSMYIYYF